MQTGLRQITGISFAPSDPGMGETFERFAKDKGLLYEPFYHDTPNVIFHEEDKGQTRLQNLQIAFYQQGSKGRISLIPLAKIRDEAGTVFVPRKTPAQSFEYETITTDDKYDSRKLYELLGQAWDEALRVQYNPEDLVAQKTYTNNYQEIKNADLKIA